MKVAFLSSSTNETTKYAQGLGKLPGVALELLRYDVEGSNDDSIFQRTKEAQPDLIVYVGSRWGAQLSTHALARLNFEVAPTVHFCSDAADPPWWDLLRTYHAAGAFALQVAIDGNHQWPLAASQMTALTPVDPIYFRASNGHAGREHACGYAGNPGAEGSPRRAIVSDLAMLHAIRVRLRDAEAESYQGYCDFLLNSRMSLNVSLTGTGAAQHVKGRVVESGLAGCLLLEPAGSPAAEWFTPGVDYLEYRSGQEAYDIIKAHEDRREETQAFGERLRAKVLAEHTPERFWSRIFDRVGVKP